MKEQIQISVLVTLDCNVGARRNILVITIEGYLVSIECQLREGYFSILVSNLTSEEIVSVGTAVDFNSSSFDEIPSDFIFQNYVNIGVLKSL